MLLSLLGVPREEKARHRGAEMALAVSAIPGRAKVFRKLRRGADLENTRPDYQDLLMDLTLWIWLRAGGDAASPPLAERVPSALSRPETIARFGGLSLGESSYLVDVVTIDNTPPDRLIFLVPDSGGFYSFPTWVDHAERKNTVLSRFRLSDLTAIETGLPLAWLRIGG
jgi:CRISPR-associated protein Cas5t